MSMWARPGRKCQCIGNSTRTVNFQGLPGFSKGEILTIAEVREFAPHGLFLSFAERAPNNWGHISGFRPLVTRTIEQDLAIFTPLLDTVEEDA